MNSILAFDSIELQFDDRNILSSVAMQCTVGEVVGLLGRNGSGKSSLMKVVFGSLRSNYSSVRINNQSLLTHPDLQMEINYLPQENLIPSYLTIRQSIRCFAIDQEKLIDALPITENWLDLRPSQCSGGSLRLLETLIILYAKGLFCILDEPFTGLMPVHIETIKRIMTEQQKVKGIIITDHLYKHVVEIADRLYVLANGKTYPITQSDQLIKYGYLNEE